MAYTPEGNRPKDAISIRARAKAAHDEIVKLSKGGRRLDGKTWTMSIPVNDRDSDIVLSAPLYDVVYLLAENAARLSQIAKLEQEIEELRNLQAKVQEYFNFISE